MKAPPEVVSGRTAVGQAGLKKPRCGTDSGISYGLLRFSDTRSVLILTAKTITGSFDIRVTLHCLNPRAASTIWPSCFANRDVSSMSGNYSPALWKYQLRLQQSLRLEPSQLDSISAPGCWTHRQERNTNAGSTICGKS